MLGLCCRAQASHCSGFSCFRAQVLDRSGFSSVAHRLSYLDIQVSSGIEVTCGKIQSLNGHFKKKGVGDFSGGPVAKTQHSQCRGTGFDPWSGN